MVGRGREQSKDHELQIVEQRYWRGLLPHAGNDLRVGRPAVSAKGEGADSVRRGGSAKQGEI